MGYPNEAFEKDMEKIIADACVEVLHDTDLDVGMVLHLLPYFVGDKLIKRELQILLDKFTALDEAKMYIADDVDNPVNEVCIYRPEAKMLLGMMDYKVKRIIDNPAKVGLGAFADGRSKRGTIEFAERLQLFIDLM